MRIICNESINWSDEMIELNKVVKSKFSEALIDLFSNDGGYIKHEFIKVYKEKPKDVLKITIVLTIDTGYLFKETFMYTLLIQTDSSCISFNKGFGKKKKVYKIAEMKEIKRAIFKDILQKKNIECKGLVNHSKRICVEEIC